MEIHRVGTDALLVEVDDPAAWYVALAARRATGELDAVDIVPAARTVLLDGVREPDRVVPQLPFWAPSHAPPAAEGELVEVPIRYGGPDLAFVATSWGVTEQAAVELVAGTEFTVAFCGFAPGFGYLTGMPAGRTVPRLPDPRPRVPAGSLGLAGEYAGIYPTASPGGWRLIGRTDVELFDVDSESPALLVPGARVRLVDVGPGTAC